MTELVCLSNYQYPEMYAHSSLSDVDGDQLKNFHRTNGKEIFRESQLRPSSWCLLRKGSKFHFRRAVVKVIVLLERDSIRQSVCEEE